jgi:hypothetical protein
VRRALVAAAIVAWSALAFGRTASAQTPPTPPPVTTGAPPPSADAKLSEAKALFKEGNDLRKAGDLQGALEFYLRSRRLVASMPNTTNAAVCLEDLGRLDEALELYEEVVTKYRDELSEREQQDIAASMSNLRRALGSVDVSGEVGGMLFVDGHPRGTLPLVAAVHVMPGRHVVRVLREGWEPFESTVDVAKGQTVPVDVKQKPLAHAGRLRIVSDNAEGAELLLDGAPLGPVPWEGTLAPGRHLFSIRKGDVGTGPIVANVIEGQTVTAPAHAVPVVNEVRVAAEPPSADVSVDGVDVGKGRWRGALPVGSHVFEAREIGYATVRMARDVSPSTSPDVALGLRIDPTHPRWAIPGRANGVFRLDVVGAFAMAPSFNGDAESACGGTACPRAPLGTGGLVGVRGGYTFLTGTFVELATGYLSVQRGLDRTIGDSFTIRATSTNVPITYGITDAMRLAGPYLAGGGGYERRLGERVHIEGALDVGVAVLTARDAIRGTATDGARTLDLQIDQSGAPARSIALFLQPEARVRVDLGAVDVTAGLGIALFLLDGPRYSTGQLQVTGGSCADHPGAVDCAPGRDTLASERAYGPFLLFLPSVAVGRAF